MNHPYIQNNSFSKPNSLSQWPSVRKIHLNVKTDVKEMHIMYLLFVLCNFALEKYCDRLENVNSNLYRTMRCVGFHEAR